MKITAKDQRRPAGAVTAHMALRIFDGVDWHEGAALRIDAGRVVAIASAPHPGDDVVVHDGWLVPGFVDLQVNGGGGAMLNHDPTPAGLARICAAHAAGGTTSLLATLITDRPTAVPAAIAAVEAARRAGQAGLMGLHLEGPHLAVARKGTHDADLIRPMEEDDLALIAGAVARVECLMVTVAPESVTPDQVARLVGAGVHVALGHSDATAAAARAHVEAGARMVTHLFNAMSGLASREPGLVGAALDDGRLSAGLIADGHHVDAAVMRVALRAKRGPGRIVLVSDAMATVATDLPGFTLNGREVTRRGGRLTLADGTLAGADVDMIACVRFAHGHLDVGVDEALRMASAHPAAVVGMGAAKGGLRAGMDADMVCLLPDLCVRATYARGRRIFGRDGP